MITIRYKPLLNGEYSIYLDVYSAGKRERKFTGLRSSKDYSKTKFISKEDVGTIEKARKMVCDLNATCVENPKRKNAKESTLILFIHEKIINVGKFRSVHLSLLKHLKLFTGKKDIPFSTVSEKWVREFEKYLNLHLAEATVNEILFTFKGVLKKAIETGLIKENPLSEYKYKKSNSDRPYFSDKEIEALASTPTTFNPVTRQAFFFSLYSGLTWEQISTLKWEQIKKEKKKKSEIWTVTINGHMNHAVYINELSSSAVSVLKEIISLNVKSLNNDVCTINMNDKLDINDVCTLSGDAFNRLPNKSNVFNKLRLWGAMAGIEKNCSFGMARNSYAMKQMENGTDKRQLRRLLTVSKIKSVNVFERMNNKKKHDKSEV